MFFLSVENINKNVGNGFVLQNISLTQKQFQKIAIAGETGSGKSSLLKAIAGLLQPDSGTIFFQGEKVLGPDFKLLPGHKGIAYLSQHYELLNNYRVEELLSYANKLSDEQAHSLYNICQISHLLKRRTDQLSGGEKQRIAMARLLTTSPSLFLLDEPFSNLDRIHKNILKEVLHDLGEQFNISFIIVSHDPQDTLSWADEMIIMKDGNIVQKGSPEELYYYPVNEYVAGLLGDYNLLNDETARLLGIEHKSKDRKLFVRPEMLSIAQEGVEAVIEKVHFQGSLYELDVLLSNEKVAVKTTKNNYKAGDTVSIILPAQQKPWFL